MVKRNRSETPANKATRTATHFFQKISDARREKREAKVRQERATEEEKIRREVDRRWADYMAKCPPVSIPRPSYPEEPKPDPEPKRVPPPPLDPATKDFLHWCFHGDPEEEDPPFWERPSYRRRWRR